MSPTFIAVQCPDGTRYCLDCAEALPDPLATLTMLEAPDLRDGDRCAGECGRALSEGPPRALPRLPAEVADQIQASLAGMRTAARDLRAFAQAATGVTTDPGNVWVVLVGALGPNLALVPIADALKVATELEIQVNHLNATMDISVRRAKSSQT